MFWVIFDTSTRPDYYRDVHNLLALPAGSTLRYDYREAHLSGAAVEEAHGEDPSFTDVLVVYAQDRNFQKGGPDPVGAMAHRQGLWVATRIAKLVHLHRSAGRYYFDLELLGYPADQPEALDAVIRALSAAGDTPFGKWVAVSDRDAAFRSLAMGTAADNWRSIVNSIGRPPSQFTGDSFWRIAQIANGSQRSPVCPSLERHVEILDGQEKRTRVEAIYPIFELDKLALQIESRTPEVADSVGDEDPEERRAITFETASDGVLKGLNGRMLPLRRYATEWIESEVSATNRISAQQVHVTINTGAASHGFPIGPEPTLHFKAAKKPERIYLSVLFAAIAAACEGVATTRESPGSIAVLVVMGVFLFGAAGFLWSGLVKLPGTK